VEMAGFFLQIKSKISGNDLNFFYIKQRETAIQNFEKLHEKYGHFEFLTSGEND
jgi:hypothetical protein